MHALITRSMTDEINYKHMFIKSNKTRQVINQNSGWIDPQALKI